MNLAIAHPGITFTGITAHYPKVIFALIKHPMKVIFMRPNRAALSILWGVFEDTEAYQWIGPKWFDVWGLPRKKKLHSCSEAEIKGIAARSEQVLNTCKEYAK